MSLEILLQRIEKAKKKKATSLVLANLDLKEIPTEIGDLTYLKSLDLENNQIQDLKPLGKLANLTELYMQNNQIKSLKGLEKLITLTALGLQNNQIQDLKPLGKLVNLTHLFLENNQVQKLPKFLLNLNQPIYYLMVEKNNWKQGIYLKNNPLEISLKSNT